MVEGKCPKCGAYRIGWALLNPKYQMCPNCGEGLVISIGGRPIAKGYSPFTAQEYIVDPSAKPPSPKDREKGSRQQNQY